MAAKIDPKLNLPKGVSISVPNATLKDSTTASIIDLTALCKDLITSESIKSVFNSLNPLSIALKAPISISFKKSLIFCFVSSSKFLKINPKIPAPIMALISVPKKPDKEGKRPVKREPAPLIPFPNKEKIPPNRPPVSSFFTGVVPGII